MASFDDALNILRALNCEDVAKAYGLEVKGHMTHCFMHNDRHPSLGFKNNHWKCFVCNKGGDAISLVMELCKVSFKEACIDLCSRFNIPLSVCGKLSYHQPLRRVKYSCSRIQKKEEVAFDAEVANSIVDFLALGTEAKGFLLGGRKLSEKVISNLSIKSLEDGGSSLKLKDLLLSKFSKERLVSCKILKESGGLNINVPSLIIPYFNEKEEIISLQTRYLKKSEIVPRFKLLCHSKKHLYNVEILSRMKKGDRLYITEGITDCLAVLSTGNNAIAIQSASSIPENELYILSGYSLYMIPDQDKSGFDAFNKLFRSFLRIGSRMTKVNLPNGVKDFSEFYVSLGEK